MGSLLGQGRRLGPRRSWRTRAERKNYFARKDYLKEKNYFEKIASSDKKLHWMETELESPFHQFSYYDQEVEVNESVTEATEWFKAKM